MALFPLSAVHKRYIQTETAVGIGFNGVLSVVFGLPFYAVSSIPLWGANGMALDLIPTVFMITLVQTIIITLITRKRVKAGAIAALPAPRASYPVLQLLAENVVVRALSLALALSLILVPLTIGVMMALDFDGITFARFISFKVVYGVAVGMLSAPLSLLAALSDRTVTVTAT